jgi:hypothetical protein
VTLSQELDQSQPSNDPTVRLRPVTVPAAATPKPQPQPRSTVRRIARRILGPTLMTKKS